MPYYHIRRRAHKALQIPMLDQAAMISTQLLHSQDPTVLYLTW